MEDRNRLRFLVWFVYIGGENVEENDVKVYRNKEAYLREYESHTISQDSDGHGKDIYDLALQLYDVIKKASPTVITAELAIDYAKKMVWQNCRIS